MANRQVNRRVSNDAVRKTYMNYGTGFTGNAVRRTEIPEESPKPRKKAQNIRREIVAAQKRANERAFGISSFIITSLAVVFVCVALFLYLGERGKMHAHTKEVKVLTQELNASTTLNDNRLTAIEAGIDYTEIYNRAVNELGMRFPGKDQVLWFTATESEYISQYEEIPKN